MSVAPLQSVLDDVGEEVRAARANWPPFNSAHEAFAVLNEEFDELKQHVWTNQKKRDLPAMKKEAIQVAAMAVSFALEVCGEERAQMTKALEDVIKERKRQLDEEGWTPEHDDDHDSGEMARAAAAYALKASGADLDGDHQSQILFFDTKPIFWPWADEWWKPRNPRRSLVKAAALLIAEIERLDRKKA